RAKTWVAMEIGQAVATGTKACGEFQAVKGRVMHFAAEDLDYGVFTRNRALAAGRGIKGPVDDLFVCPAGEFLDLAEDEDAAWIIASCRRWGKVDLLILDPLRDIHSGDEDKSGDMREVLRRIRLIGEILECTVLVNHHTSKDGDTSKGPGQNLRGSSA